MGTPIQATTSIYASDIISTFDFYKPENFNKLLRKYGQQGYEYFTLLKSLGFETPVARDLYSWYEENLIHDDFIIDTPAAAGAAGASVVLHVSPNSVQLYDGTIYNVYPRQWDTVIFPNEVTASITSMGAITAGGVNITVTPNSPTDSIPAIAANQEVVITANGWAEGSTQPNGRLSGTTKNTNYLQIIKETLEGTGSEMTNQDWFDTLLGTDGSQQKIVGYMMKGQIDLDYRMALFASNALLFQKPTLNTNTALQDALSPTNSFIKTTEGLIPAVRRAGQVIPYQTGLFSISKFDEIDKTLDAQFSGQDCLWLNGIDLGHQIENTMVNYFKNTEISYVKDSYFKGDEGLAMSVGFKSFQKSGRNHNFMKMGIFSHPKVGGVAGYNYPSLGVILPMNSKKDKKTMEDVPSFGMRYKALGAYNRKSEIWNQSGAGNGLKVIPNDLARFFQRTHIGAQHFGLNRFVLLDPQ